MEGSYVYASRSALKEKLVLSSKLLLAQIFILSFMFSFSFYAPLRSIGKIFTFKFIFHYIFTSILTISLLILQKKVFKIKQTNRGNLFTFLNNSLNLHVLLVILFNTISGFIISWTFSRINDNEQHLKWMLLYGTYIGFVSSLSFFISGENKISFPIIHQSFFFSLKGKLLNTFISSTKFAMIQTTIFLCLVFILRSLNLRFLSSFPGLEFSTILFFFSTGIFLAFNWKMKSCIFQVAITQPITISDLSNLPFRCLVSGLADSKEPLIQHLAYLELSMISKYDVSKRKKLFQDLSHKPTSWDSISTECLSIIEKIRTSLEENKSKLLEQAEKSKVDVYTSLPQTLRTGKQTRSNENEPSFLEQRSNVPTSQNALVQFSGAPQNIFAKSQSQPSTALSIFRTEQGVQQPKEAPKPTFPTFSTALPFGPNPNLTTNPTPAPLRTNAKDLTLVDLFVNVVLKVFPFLKKIPKVSSQQEEIFANLQIQIWAIQSISGLVSASLKEDDFGIVQHTLPNILTTLLNCLAVVESFSPSLAMIRNKRDPQYKFKKQIECITQVLKLSIYQITSTFGALLNEIELSSQNASRLRSFLSYSE